MTPAVPCVTYERAIAICPRCSRSRSPLARPCRSWDLPSCRGRRPSHLRARPLAPSRLDPLPQRCVRLRRARRQRHQQRAELQRFYERRTKLLQTPREREPHRLWCRCRPKTVLQHFPRRRDARGRAAAVRHPNAYILQRLSRWFNDHDRLLGRTRRRHATHQRVSDVGEPAERRTELHAAGSRPRSIGSWRSAGRPSRRSHRAMSCGWWRMQRSSIGSRSRRP